MQNKQIYIVLSRSGTILSHIIHAITRDSYTHASIALDVDLDLMFSFGRRYERNPFLGCFKKETVNDRHFRFGRSGLVLELSVTEEQYDEVFHNIRVFCDNPDAFSYNLPGLITGIFNRTHERETRFFCSEFVYFVLNEAGICDFGITRGHVRPQMFLRRLNGRVVFDGKLPAYALQRREFAPAR
ncbi:MAG: hypothetical protein LBN00_08345 [Oscillospiraceae bacterium]|jgi:hypothetical protein|nr:hypothetical protein [Oscillospiraceae bacterium]